MSLQVTLTFANESELLAYFAGRGAQPEPAPERAQPKAEAAPAPKAKPASASTKSSPASATTQPAAAPAAEATEGNAAAASSAPEAPAASTASSSAAVDYPTLQKAVFALANSKGRDSVIGLMKDTFGVGSAKELKPEQWADALAAVNAALEG